MKKNAVLATAVAAAIASLTVVPAQALIEWRLGVKGGVNIADFIGDDADVFVFDDPELGFSASLDDARAGFVGGAFCEAKILSTFGLRVEALYVQKGREGSATVDLGIPVDVDFALNLTYFELPVLAVLYLPVSPLVDLSVFAGPTFAFNTDAEVEVEAFGISESADFDEFVSDSDVGGVVGAGVGIGAGPVIVLFDGRYGFSFTSIDDTITDFDIKNSGFAFMGGIAFPLGR